MNKKQEIWDQIQQVEFDLNTSREGGTDDITFGLEQELKILEKQLEDVDVQEL